ncbi:calcium-binding protein [Pseudomonas sp. UBA7721]|uniref:calcium-binding protein n=1 Tax=Pseudomonas sp. UBA7721 TaxID=1947343 RepID=UPI00257DA244|nr:calcium-binding protein [Pseudomonas sp. UBA7721]
MMNSTADTIAPNLSSLKIPKIVDLGLGVSGLTIDAVASDDLSGIKNVQVWFDRNFTYSYTINDSQKYSSNLLLNQGLNDSWLDGSSAQTWFIAATNPSGVYNITHVVVEDLQGNTHPYYKDELAEIGVNTSISFINSTPDITPPKITSLNIPATVDLASGTGDLTINALVTDDLSGIKNIQFWFDKNFTYSYTSSDGQKYSSNLLLNQGLYDSWLDGSSSETWKIAGTNPSGAYNITNVRVEDLQGNTRIYTSNELSEIGVNTSILFTNSTPDVTPPTLVSLIIPSAIELSSGTTGLSIDAFITDDYSGVKNIQVWFDKDFTYSYTSSEGQKYSSNLLLNQGLYDSWSDGSSSETWFIAATNPSGVYNVHRVIVEDLQGNTRTYSQSELNGMGVNTSINFFANKSTLTSGNDNYSGTSYPDWVLGMEGNDIIKGLGGDDLLDGGEGNDVLDGGVGADTMIGGLGDDTYYVDSGKDVIIEYANGGVDTVISSVSRTLGNYQENLILSGTAGLNGTGNSLDNTLTGNSADNLLNGGAGADTMIGGLGNDTYYVDSGKDVIVEAANSGIDTVISSGSRTLGNHLENLILSGKAAINGTGNSLDNMLMGNSADNVLNGGGGADTMIGGMGNDTYYVDSAKDVIIEALNGGIDTVISSGSRTLGDNLEKLVLSGIAAINGTGNSMDNTLIGNSADNVLNGGAGADTMIGGLGNDTYYVDSGNDVIIEAANGGIDTVISSSSRTLGGNLEKLILSGTTAINGTGNSSDNTLAGNSADNVLNGGAGADILLGGAGNDRLIGGLGQDILTGGSGRDVFDFNDLNETGLTTSTWDIITDFERGIDKIDLSTLDANTATSTNDEFTTIIGSDSNFTQAGQLKFSNGILYGNTNSDSSPEFAIKILGISEISYSDIVL